METVRWEKEKEIRQKHRDQTQPVGRPDTRAPLSGSHLLKSDQTPAAGSFCTPGPSKPRVIRVLPGEQPALPLPLALTCFPERHATSWLGFIPCIGSDVALQSVHGTSTDGTEYSKSRMNNTKPESNSLKISSTQRQRGERVLALHTGVLAEEARIQLLFSVSCHSVKLRGRNL